MKKAPSVDPFVQLKRKKTVVWRQNTVHNYENDGTFTAMPAAIFKFQTRNQHFE